MAETPQGTVTFVFTDIVGSTRLWEKFPSQMGAALARHDALLRETFSKRGGHVFKTVGDAFCVAFESPREAVVAAVDAQRLLAQENWEEVGTLAVRIGVHTGVAEARAGDYFGGTLNRVARIEAAAHGGQILVSQVSVELLEDERMPEITFQSLGSHRLRNLDRPEHLYQVVAQGLAEDFPPPKSMEVLPNNLPVQATSFVGREREMEQVRNLIGATRLLTLTGTGGTGKTRLSLEVGAQLINEFRDGVWQVELATISEPRRVAELVANALGAREEAGKTMRQSVIQFLRDKNLLLILDNCEHLLEESASLSAELLRNCPQLKILATSRHSLGIAGESSFFVPPLRIFDVRLEELRGPDIVEQLTQYEAVKLFIARAVAVQPDFAVTNENAPFVAEICSRLDGIPLAIELAAARVRLLSVDQIAARLGDRFRLLRGGRRDGLPHQQTLGALIDWSHDLLSEAERILFRRLGVFIGGRTLEALEAVCAGDGIEKWDVLDLLQELVEKSLVTVERDDAGESRYTLIESVWQYAREKLEAAGEAEKVRDRHLDYFLSIAEKMAAGFVGPDQVRLLERYYRERFNFRRAIEWAVEAARIEKGMRLLRALDRPIELRGNLTAAFELASKLLEHPEANSFPARKAALLDTAGRLCWALDRYEETRKLYLAAEVLYRELGMELEEALEHSLMGFLDRGELLTDSAEERFRRGLEVGGKCKDERLVAMSLSGLGSVMLDRGNLDEARRMKEESLVIYRRIGDLWVIGLILWGIGRVCVAQKDFARSEEVVIEWAGIAKDLGNEWILSYILETSADAFLAASSPAFAARLLGGAEAIRRHFGARFSPSELEEQEARLTALHKALPAETIEKEWEAGKEISGWQLIEEAKAFVGSGKKVAA